jgi:hypothetical protein
MEACHRHKKLCDDSELIKHTFPGGKYDKLKTIYDKIDDTNFSLLQKANTYSMHNEFEPVVSNEYKYCRHHCAFDIEVLLKNI